MSMSQKIIAIACLLVAAVFAIIAFDPLEIVDFDLKHGLTRKNGFVDNVSEDLAAMRAKKLLPKEWDSIQYIAYNFHTDLQRRLVGHRKFKIKDDPQGNYRLEIEFIDVPDEEAPAIILQMSLFDLASNNKIFEVGRTHSIAGFLTKEKSEPAKPKAQAPSASQPEAAAQPSAPPAAQPASPPVPAH